MMCKLETAIRTSKRKLVGYKASGSEDAYTDESIRLRRLREEYKSFSQGPSMILDANPTYHSHGATKYPADTVICRLAGERPKAHPE